MTLQQGLAFGLVAATIAGFVWGRFRYDVVAVTALVVGVAIGVVPAKSAFDGLSNDVTVIIGAALVVSAAFSRSGIVELVMRRILPLLKSERSQVPALTAAVTLLSMVTKNVGALAIMMPVADQVARRTGTSPSRLLMPMSFGAMMGGLVTLVGTAPNIIVAEVRADILGKPFGMYDYAPVGLILTACALLFLAVGYRLLPKERQGAVSLDAALAGKAYVTEATVPEDWGRGPMRLGALAALSEGDVVVSAMLRNGRRKPKPHPNTMIGPGDVLLLEGEQQALDAFITRAKLALTRANRPETTEEASEETRTVEVVVGSDSSLIGASARNAQLYADRGINLLGVSRPGFRVNQHLRTVRLRSGDMLLVRGGERALASALQDLDLMPLAERTVKLGGPTRQFAPVVILAAAMILVAMGAVPVAIAFFGAAVAMVLVGALRMREAYSALDGPLLVLIAALIPVSGAIQQTGGADLIAHWLSGALRDLPGVVAVGAIMFASMAVTPFLNNAATVLIVAPIGAVLAKQLGYNPDAFLMAVAVGAACDFLTPIGHQCNTLVMAPGGYRFSDYPRLGAPLSIMVLLIGPPLILLFWHLH